MTYVSVGKDTEDAGRFNPSRRHLAGCQGHTLINPAFSDVDGSPYQPASYFFSTNLDNVEV